MHGVGTDVELVSSIAHDSESFRERNFTTAELSYVDSAPDPRGSLAARWAAKEAVVKSLHVETKGAAAPLKDIEVVSTSAGPTIVLHGDVAKLAAEQGISRIEISLSHSDDVACAVAVAQK